MCTYKFIYFVLQERLIAATALLCERVVEALTFFNSCISTFCLLFLDVDSDVDLTYEGDNVILLQAMAKALLDEFLGRLGTGK